MLESQAHEQLDAVSDVPLVLNHKRTKVINHDNNIDLILAGRAKKISIDVPDEPKVANQRLQKIIIESENDFKHMLGEVSGEKYEICGRPELELISVGFAEKPTLRKTKLHVYNREIDENNTDAGNSTATPVGVPDVHILYCTSKTCFIYSPKHEDQLLALLKDYPNYELIIKSAQCLFGSYSFSTLDQRKQREWRRFVREFLQPQLIDEERMTLMEDRLNFEIPYEDDGIPDSEPNSSEEEEEDIEIKKKRGKRKGRATKKKTTIGIDSMAGAPVIAANVSKKETMVGPSTSARVQQRMSSKKGIGLLAKRGSTKI
eukprot:gene21619-24514_t